MRIGIYGDVHFNRKRVLSGKYESSLRETFDWMYTSLRVDGVEEVVCLGDFFDKSTLTADYVELLRDLMSKVTVKTRFLLGNHEILKPGVSILSLLNCFENAIPVEEITHQGQFLYVPYGESLEGLDMRGKYVFTHTDIYGSELAGGKVKASFGIDPTVFQEATYVFNGHVHLASKLGNIYNVGSIVHAQFGEEKSGVSETGYYILDTETNELEFIPNPYTLHFLTRSAESLDLAPELDRSRLILRVDYT